MALTPFHEIPKGRFLNRMIVPIMGIYVLFFLCSGVIANTSSFREDQGPAAVIPFWAAAMGNAQKTISSLLHLPEVCWLGNTVNDFQVQQCNMFWGNLLKSGILTLAPFLALIAVYFFAQDQFASIYVKVRKQIDQGKVAFTGVVTDPPEAPADWVSWYYCLRPLTVQLPNKSQVLVYISLDAIPPRPGETLVVFDAGIRGGKRRYLGMLYAPHVAVMRG